MSRSYGIKKDFGLHGEGGVFLPDTPEASTSQSAPSYRSTMPAYYVDEHKTGRGQHGKLNISSGTSRTAGSPQGKDGVSDDTVPTVGEKSGSVSGPREKSTRRWFSSRKKPKKGRDPSSLIDQLAEGESVARSSPMLHVRSAMRGGEKDQFGRPQADLEEPGEEEVRMELSYEAPVTKAATELVRLTLRSGRESSTTSDTLQVTLRKRGQGFGLHLSSGLPPITVTYVEPGGSAEAAGVRVGDRVVEVNGEDCETLKDASKIIALKMLIQQTDIGAVSENINETEPSAELNDTTWNKIQARQHQNETESQNSSNVDLTQIDGDSDTENVLEKFLESAEKHSQQKHVNISSSDWERMREQRELLFDKNAPSAIIQEKGRKKEADDIVQPSLPQKSPKPTTGNLQQDRDEEAAGIVPSPEKHTPKSSGGGWFKRKKKRDTSSEVSGASSRAAAEQAPTKEKGKSPTKRGHGRSEIGTRTADGKHSKTQRGAKAMKITSIDDVEVTEKKGETGKKGRKKKDAGEMSEHIRKTFSYEGTIVPPDASQVTTSLPRSRSHNAMFRATLIQAVQQQLQSPPPGTLPAAPTTSHHRSMSYEDEEGRGTIQMALSQDEGWEDTRLGVEARTTSRSQSDISRIKIDVGGGMDANVRLKKSGVVKGVPSWGQRPPLEVFGEKEKRDDRVTETTDGPALSEFSTGNDAKTVDLGAVPQTNPSLGQISGRTRRDLVARSSVKRRPPRNREALLFKVDEDQKMGTKRVELSEFTPTNRSRTHTMPEKMSRKVIESTPVTSSLTLPSNRYRDNDSRPAKTRGETRNIFKELQQHSTSNSLKQPSTSSSVQRPSTSNSLKQPSTSSSVQRPSTSSSVQRPSTSSSVQRPSTSSSVQQPAGERERVEMFHMQRQSSDTSTTSSSAEMVARAVANKKRLSSTEEEGRKASEGAQREGEGEEQTNSLCKGTASSAILAKLRHEKQVENGRGLMDVVEEKEEVKEGRKESKEAMMEAEDKQKQRVEEEQKQKTEKEQKAKDEKEAESEKRQPHVIPQSRRRNKTVEKPVKSLGIVSDPDLTNSADQTPQRSMVTLRKAPASEPRPVSSSSSTPSWVAVAERKKQRVSAMFVKDDGAKAQSPPRDPPSLSPTSPPITTSTSSTPPITEHTTSVTTTPSSIQHTTTISSPRVTKSTSPPITKFTSPPVTKPTSTPVTKSTSPPITEPTSPPITKPTSTPVTKPTFPTITKPTSTPVTKLTSTPITKPTSTPVTKPTSTPITKPTSPPVTKPTSTPVTKPTFPTITKRTSTPITKLTSTPITKPTSPPVTGPTSTPITKPTSPPITKPTSTPITKPTSPPVTKPTFPTVTKPTSTPITKLTSTPVTKPTSPTITKSTSTSVTKLTSPPITTPHATPTSKSTTTTTNKASNESTTLRKGTVRDRIALFQ